MAPTNPDEQHEKPEIPLGVAVDDRPTKRVKLGASNDPEDRRRALLLIACIVGVVLLLVILGNTVFRPFIVAQHEQMLVDITQRQVDDLADLALEYRRTQGILPTGFVDLASQDRLETSDGTDQWGTGFVFDTRTDSDGSRIFKVLSAGPDAEFGTDDDIVSQRIVESDESAESP